MPGTRPAIVHLVDDDPADLELAGRLLARARYELRTYPSGRAFLDGWHGPGLACAVLDLRMPGLGGFDVLRALANIPDAPPVIVMTSHGNIETAVTAMKLGAVDFVEKSSLAVSLLPAVAGATEVARRTLGRAADRAEAEARVATLTPREREVLGAMLAGDSNKIVAYRLGVSPRTVELHRANVMTKLGVRSLSRALQVAIAAGVVDG